MEILEGITSQQAAARPRDAVHNIWEIALHIAAWERAGVMRLQGDRAQLPTEKDWPPINEMSELAWKQTGERLNKAMKSWYTLSRNLMNRDSLNLLSKECLQFM